MIRISNSLPRCEIIASHLILMMRSVTISRKMLELITKLALGDGYRDRIDIFNDILQIANGGIDSKTEITYRANISHAQLKEYIMFLMENGLVCYDLDNHSFKTTEKGLGLLMHIQPDARYGQRQHNAITGLACICCDCHTSFE